MASYASYKKVDGATQLVDGSVPQAAVASGVFDTWNVRYYWGSPNRCSTGCCCLWTVPTGVRRVFFEMWGAGGNGHGMCSTGRCQHYAGAQGGYYASKMIQTAPGCQYTICAAGTYPCEQNSCDGCHGCASYANGYNLSNFCALGGTGGCANGSWNEACHSTWGRCCVSPTAHGSDFTMGNHRGAFFIHMTHCHWQCFGASPTSAPFIGTSINQNIHECWMRCGCWTSPYGHGGQGAMTTYCGGSGCCGRGSTGGPGLVKVSYL